MVTCSSIETWQYETCMHRTLHVLACMCRFWGLSASVYLSRIFYEKLLVRYSQVKVRLWFLVPGAWPGGGGTSMFSVPGMCRWTGYSFHHSCSRAGYRFLQKCSQKGILFSNFCSQTGLQCIFLILCSQTGCGFLQFCSQTGVFKMRKMLPDRVKSQHLKGTHPYILGPSAPPGALGLRK